MEQQSQIADELRKTLTLDSDDDVDTDFEFTFSGDRTSPVPAEDIFHNGQIRPIFPFSSSEEATTTSYVRKIFVSSPERNDVIEGPYCAWSEKSSEKVPAPEMRRKSNSTGFSKLRRFRDLLVRSHSDGKDAFVFLAGKGDEKVEKTTSSEKKKKEKKAEKATESETASVRETKKKGKGREKSAYEVFYGNKDKKKGVVKGRSYLPYKQDLVGFFTTVNGISRNVHPY